MTPRNARQHKQQQQKRPPTVKAVRRSRPKRQYQFLLRVIQALNGTLIGMLLAILFSIVIFAVVVRAFTASDQISFQLLQYAVTLVSTTLSGVLVYVLGRGSGGRPRGGT